MHGYTEIYVVLMLIQNWFCPRTVSRPPSFGVCFLQINKAQCSQYVPHCGNYMYRTVVTIRTAQWSLYVPHSGHHMYRTVVTICTAQWSPYVPHSGHYMYRTVVTIRTTSFNIQQLYVLPTNCILSVLCGSENKQRLFPYTALTDWFL